MNANPLSWWAIAKLGLVQASLGAIVVLATSTMNRVMVVELLLPAALPGALVGLHYAVQMLRPRLGYGSDVGDRRTPWIVGGIALLGCGAVLAATSIGWMDTSPVAGTTLAVIAFILIGLGAGSAGTSLLVLLAKRVDERRRAAAATVVWLMMIAGFVITTVVVGALLDPYSAPRLLAMTAAVALMALLVTSLAVRGLEPRGLVYPSTQGALTTKPSFREALGEVWGESQARRFTIFVFVSMLAYSAQDLILEPFAGTVFGMTPGQSTQLAGLQHGGVLCGMLMVAFACSLIGGPRLGSLRLWTVSGCIASAVCLAGLTIGGMVGPGWPLRANTFLLGLSNGAFAVAAISSMMSFASQGRASREGVRMGLWGAAQAIAFGLGGFIGAGCSDLARLVMASPGLAYGLVFAVEATLFIAAALIATRLGPTPDAAPTFHFRRERAPLSAPLGALERPT